MGAQFNIREITDTSVVAKTPHAPISYVPVRLKLPALTHVCRPLLKEPPQLSAQGEVVAPMPEKTFFEKYWIYLLGVLLALREWSVTGKRITADMIQSSLQEAKSLPVQAKAAEVAGDRLGHHDTLPV
jgi:hypothetical protein